MISSIEEVNNAICSRKLCNSCCLCGTRVKDRLFVVRGLHFSAIVLTYIYLPSFFFFLNFVDNQFGGTSLMCPLYWLSVYPSRKYAG